MGRNKNFYLITASNVLFSRELPDFINCSSLNKDGSDFSFVDYHNRYHYILSQIFQGILYSAPLTILALTIDRYVLVCHPRLSLKIRQKRSRIISYSFLTLCTLLMPIARVVDFFINYKKKTVVRIYFFSLRKLIKKEFRPRLQAKSGKL